jgi:hypothetical protein
MASADRLLRLVDLSRALSSSLDLEDVLRCFTARDGVNGAAEPRSRCGSGIAMC